MRLFRRRRGHRRARELAPEDILLDAENLPDFDHARLEGKLEQPIPRSTYRGAQVIVVCMLLVLVGKAAHLELVKGAEYAAQSERNRVRPEVIFASRGAILDRNGVTLVSNKDSEDGRVKRLYASPGFGHLLGYVSYPKKDTSGNYYDTEIKGLSGVEAALNEELAGTNGRLLIEEDARGSIQSQGTVLPPVNGANVALAIDERAQRALHTAVAGLAEKVPYMGGAGILMDAHTGEVHALVSYPEFDPNILSSGTPADVIASYQTDSRKIFLDRAVAGLYTPGSIVKPMEAAGALSDGLITPETTVYSKGYISIPNPYNPDKPTIFKDWKAHGSTDTRAAIAWSSDAFFYSIGGGYEHVKGLGIERLKYWYDSFGFTSPTGIELFGEKTGFVPTPAWKEKTLNEPWRIGDTYNTSIGQYAMQVTPLEAARAVAAVANGGKLVRPTILKGKPPEGQSIAISQYALQVAREGMREAVTYGTAKGLGDLSYVSLAAKTGTAQLGFKNEWHNSWVVGFFPYEKPKYVFVVLMERGPASNSLGGVYVMHQTLQELHRTAPEYFAE
jgi:penicillin-binding protein 2